MKNWGISKKVWFVIHILVAAFIVSTTLSIKNLIHSNESMSKIGHIDFKRAILAASIKDGQRTLALNAFEMDAEESLPTLKNLEEQFYSLFDKQQQRISKYITMVDPGREKIFDPYYKAQEKWKNIVAASYTLKLKGENQKAKELLKTGHPERAILLKFTDDLVSYNETTTDAKIIETTNANEFNIKVSVIIAGISIVLAVFLAFVILRMLMGSIKGILQSLTQGAVEVSSASKQIATASESLSQDSTEQAASVEETVSSIEEMNAMLNSNKGNASSTAEISKRSMEVSKKGQAVVSKMIETMDKINDSNSEILKQIEDGNQEIARIAKVVEAIATKTAVINDIVSQTKLLSFNASVEAARAGEHGKGFSVVAEEVGKLANLSGGAANEINKLIEESLSTIKNIIKGSEVKVASLMKSSNATLSEGNGVARECGKVLDEIVENIMKVSTMAEAISQACKQQSSGIDEISVAVRQLNAVAQNTTVTSQECASAATELFSQAESLNNTVHRLSFIVNGEKKLAYA